MLSLTFTVVGPAIRAQESSYQMCHLSPALYLTVLLDVGQNTGPWFILSLWWCSLVMKVLKNRFSQHRNEHVCSFHLVHLLKPHLSFIIYKISIWVGGITANTVQLSWPSANEISSHINYFNAPLVESVHNWPVFYGNQEGRIWKWPYQALKLPSLYRSKKMEVRES